MDITTKIICVQLTAMLAFLVLQSGVLKAQDTERKDICESITVYYKARVNGLYSQFLADKLQHRLMEIQTIDNIRVNPHSGTVVFEVSSCIGLTELQLSRLISDAGFIPLEIKFSRNREEIYLDELVNHNL